MSRPKGKLDVETIKITTTKEVVRALDVLLLSGMFGRSIGDVAEQLLRNSIMELITSGDLEKITERLSKNS